MSPTRTFAAHSVLVFHNPLVLGDEALPKQALARAHDAMQTTEQ
jgi:hypothetical protein